MGDADRDRLLFAAGGCASGFLWSVLAGEADLGTGEGWGRALMGCAGSAANAFTLHWITDQFTTNDDIPNIVAGSWLGAQSLASMTNWIGHEQGWEREPAFNAVAIPLNFAAAPAFSSLGLVWAGIGEIATGFTGDVSAFGGMLIFDHNLCLSAMNTGAIGHCFNASSDYLPRHEQGHQVQFSIMGDVGMLTIGTTDFLVGTIGTLPSTYGAYIFVAGPGALTLEPWANDYAGTFNLSSP